MHVIVATVVDPTAGTVLAFAALVAVVFALIGFAKSLINREWNAVITTALWWVAGFAGVALFAQTTFADHVVILGVHLSTMGVYEFVVIGLSPGSFGIVVNETHKAIDRTQTAAKSPVLHAAPPAPPAVSSSPEAHESVVGTIDADDAFDGQ